jgi:hypothetical protein
VPETTWEVLRAANGERHTARYLDMRLEVSRGHAQSVVLGFVFSSTGSRLERFSAACTIEQAKARCVRVADRFADDRDIDGGTL